MLYHSDARATWSSKLNASDKSDKRLRLHYNTIRPHSALGYRPPAPEEVIAMDQRPVMH
ncbi:MAG: integrase core domain-containing protein [Rhodospirillales bacterium]|nr:hypothetical protein [Rhodospirillaceae bacterium]MDP6109631.1 integrase core domain-containing protein [Rhodospirillales bacterium]